MRDNNPSVSVDMPVCNGDQYVAGAVESLLAQTYRDFDLITDNSGVSGSFDEDECTSMDSEDNLVAVH